MATLELYTRMASSDQPYYLSETKRAKVHRGICGIRSVAIKEVIGCTREIDLMAIRNRNIIQFYRHSDRIQVMDFADHGNLADNIGNIKKIGYKNEEIAKQISRGLVYLQYINIVHKKIRPSNILLDRNFDAKIAGFGSESDDLDKNRPWMAPELLSDPPSPHSHRTDIYALGKIMDIMGKGSKDYMQWMVRCQDCVPQERPLECPISDEPRKGEDLPELGSTTKEEKLQELKGIALKDKSGNVANHLGEMYRFEIKVPMDDDEALKWYLVAANLGNARAQYVMGTRCYDMGNRTAAEDWYLKSAKQEHQEACQPLGELLLEQRRYEEAREWVHEAASAGNARAQYCLGEVYYQRRTKQDDLQAFEWFYKAAVQGYDHAEYSVGYMYAHGKGTALNYEEAEKWYRKAIKNKNSDAERDLERMLKMKREHDRNRALWPDQLSLDEVEDIIRQLGISHTPSDPQEFYQRIAEGCMKN
ncbi:hypothetical protein BG011_010091 [Mortierella polycephala]|uniref:Protein kinase domain-containing protein n=1 Tax=Mortierella polycephala TaxID=41804 RepID=A0A9P6TW69_9FUNG|nr:hypothetical protein BG011_010091 [Mortierella polycephala]